jgi:hypothetical protein
MNIVALTTGDWMDAGAAVATAIAVLVAAFAARESARAARAAARAAEATEQQLAAQTLPLLVEVARGETLTEPRLVSTRFGERIVKSHGELAYELNGTGGTEGLCLVPFQNIGTGVARVTRAILTAETGNGTREVASNLPDDRVYVRPGEDEYVKTYTKGNEEAGWMKHAIQELDGGHPLLRVWFEDFAGEQRFELEAQIRPALTDPPAWWVTSCKTVSAAEHPAD